MAGVGTTGTRGKSPLVATLLVAAGACCFGSVSTLTLVGTGAGTSLETLIMWRYLLAAPILLFAAGGRSAFAIPAALRWRIILLGGGGQAVVTALTLVALRWVPAATEAFLFYTYPAFVTIIAAARGTEQLTRSRVIALVLALGGIGVMVGSPGAAALNPLGVTMVIAGALAYAIYIPLLDGMRHATNAATTTAWLSVGAAAIFGAWAAVDGSLFAPMATKAWGAAVLLAVVCTTAAFLLLLRGLAVLGPVRTAIVCTVEPFWTSVLAALLLGQPITGRTVAGGALIALAVLLLQIGGMKIDPEDLATAT